MATPYVLSVIIASHNRRDRLRRCLDSLRHQTQDPSTFEVIVADNGSDDGTAEMVEQLDTPFSLRVLRIERAGKSPALNAAIEAATGKICLFLDDDVVASPSLVSEHIAGHRQSANVLGIGALTQQPPAARDWYAHAHARAWNERYETLAERPLHWGDCYGGNFSAPRDALAEVGGFAADVDVAEDLELGYRLWRDAGSFPTYLPRARALHDDQKRRRRLLEDQRRFGAACAEFSQRDPGMCRQLLGWFAEPTVRDVSLRRLLLALRIPPLALAAFGPLMPGRGLRQVWFGFVTRYSFWRGVRRAMTRAEWIQTTRGTPVLMYHAFSDTGEDDRYVLRRRMFARQMWLLAALRYRVIGFAELARTLRDGGPLPRRAVVITIDDGYRDAVEIAQPILRRRSYPATIFLVSGRIGGRNDWVEDGPLAGRPLVSFEEIETLRADGFEFGAHTRSHPSLPDATDDVISAEVAGSREDLEAALGGSVETFAYPYGLFDQRAVSAAGRAGFLGACTGEISPVYPGTDPLLIPRIEIWGSDSTRGFLRKLLFGRG